MVATVAPLHVLMLVVTAAVAAAVVAVAATISTLVASNLRRVLPQRGLQA
jgi:hypothetical protein